MDESETTAGADAAAEEGSTPPAEEGGVTIEGAVIADETGESEPAEGAESSEAGNWESSEQTADGEPQADPLPEGEGGEAPGDPDELPAEEGTDSSGDGAEGESDSEIVDPVPEDGSESEGDIVEPMPEDGGDPVEDSVEEPGRTEGETDETIEGGETEIPPIEDDGIIYTMTGEEPGSSPDDGSQEGGDGGGTVDPLPLENADILVKTPGEAERGDAGGILSDDRVYVVMTLAGEAAGRSDAVGATDTAFGADTRNEAVLAIRSEWEALPAGVCIA